MHPSRVVWGSVREGEDEGEEGDDRIGIKIRLREQPHEGFSVPAIFRRSLTRV